MKSIQFLLKILIILIIIGIGYKVYLNYLYYPSHPTTYTVDKANLNPTKKPSQLDISPPVGGCFNQCSGKKTEDCKEVSASMVRCTVTCYGKVYNTCEDKAYFWKLLLF